MAQERAYSTEEINTAVRKHLSPKKPVKIGGVDGHDGVLAGLEGEGRVTITGDAGAFLAAFLDGPEVNLQGTAGDFVGSTMASGRLLIEGTVGRGLCCHMAGGEARVKGRVGPGTGAMMTGGLLVLDAPVGPGPGEGMKGGTLVLLRPNHLPPRPPPPPARVVVPRGTTKDVEGMEELEMDHTEVADLAAMLEGVGVASAERVADLLVVLVPEEGTLPAAVPVAPTVEDREGRGVTLDVSDGPEGGEGASEEGDADDGDASARFARFSQGMRDRRDVQ